MRPAARLPLLVGIAVALVVGGLLTGLHHTARLIVPPRTAIKAALHGPEASQVLADAHWDRITVTPIDNQLEHVSFLSHGQLVAEAAIDRAGQVVSREGRHDAGPVRKLGRLRAGRAGRPVRCCSC